VLRNLRCAFTKQFAFSQFALYKITAQAQIAQTVLDYLPKCCNSAFVKVIVLKANVKKNRNYNIDIAYNVTIITDYNHYKGQLHAFISI